MGVASTDRFTTLHPTGKQGVRIERTKYDQMRRALLRAIPTGNSGVLFKELSGQVAEHLTPEVFPPGTGVTWYVVAVKQDLEARGEIEIVPSSRPQRLRRVKGNLR